VKLAITIWSEARELSQIGWRRSAANLARHPGTRTSTGEQVFDGTCRAHPCVPKHASSSQDVVTTMGRNAGSGAIGDRKGDGDDGQ
jgi:hypothetical protein